jgi:hypothetical protein
VVNTFFMAGTPKTIFAESTSERRRGDARLEAIRPTLRNLGIRAAAGRTRAGQGVNRRGSKEEEGMSPRQGQGRFRSGRTLGRLACTSITS